MVKTPSQSWTRRLPREPLARLSLGRYFNFFKRSPQLLPTFAGPSSILRRRMQISLRQGGKLVCTAVKPGLILQDVGDAARQFARPGGIQKQQA